MFSLTVAAASLLLALSSTPPRTAAVTPVIANGTALDVLTVKDHLDSARRALNDGAFDVARREFVIAAALDRDAGNVPVDASFGLAHCLYSQSYNREAALVMNKLADEAAIAGDVETEARALSDAVWLNVDAKQYGRARLDAIRLRAISGDTRISAETRKLIKARIG